MTDIVKALNVCANEVGCDGCFLDTPCNPECVYELQRIAAKKIEELTQENEELRDQNETMLLQLRGDCGVCRHRHNSAISADGLTINEPCYTCMTKETHPNWEYEALIMKKKRSVSE